MTTPAIIDAHHHIWQLESTPWLTGPSVPRIFGPYEPIKRDYSIDEFAQDSGPSGVRASVYVQVNVAPGDEVDEVAWAGQQGRMRGLIQGVISFVNLASDDAGDVLDRQLAVGPVRGVRQQLHWHDNPAYRFAATPDSMLRPEFLRGLREVDARGLTFDLQVFPAQYTYALELVDRNPNLVFVLLHAGMPEDSSEAGTAQWLSGLREFSRRDNVVVKLSGLGTFLRRCSIESWSPVIQRTLDIFGPDRCMFGSNFPIEKLWTDYGRLVEVFTSAISTLSSDEQSDVLAGVARRVYRIDERS